jgi:hypothetical protein
LLFSFCFCLFLERVFFFDKALFVFAVFRLSVFPV